MRSREFWLERSTAHIYAVELTDGIVTGLCGPLPPHDADPAFAATYAYAAAGAAELEQRRADFDLLTERDLVLLAKAAD